MQNSHIQFDFERENRIGLPEAIFCEGKDKKSLFSLLERFNRSTGQNVLFTRLAPEIFYELPKTVQDSLEYHELSRIAFAHRGEAKFPSRRVAIVSAGTSDASVAWEAGKTLEFFGVAYTMFEDCGVAGLWRIEKALPQIKEHDIVIAVAGLDGALISVLGGLVSLPILAVPTSIGYGMAKNGESALSSMLISCASGISVYNIDNGYGASCGAYRMLKMAERVK